MKRRVSLFIAMAMSLAVGVISVSAEEAATGYSAYAPGVTVEQDSESPTGYKATTFVYAQQESYEGQTGEIVELHWNNRKGKIETVAYTSASGNPRGLVVYLPYGYSENRSEPYKVLYLSHGAPVMPPVTRFAGCMKGDVATLSTT